VAIPRPIRDPEEFKPTFLPEGDPAQRKQARIRVYEEILVAYRFLNRRDGTAASDVFKGKLLDISEGGLQVEGTHPKDITIPSLRAGDILIGMNIFLPYVDSRMKVLGQVTSEKQSETKDLYCLGVRFVNMDEAARASLKSFFIASQMPARKKRAPKPD
jgi:c-di-GMP-binding flagellar brake protein YcgR